MSLAIVEEVLYGIIDKVLIKQRKEKRRIERLNAPGSYNTTKKVKCFSRQKDGDIRRRRNCC